MTDARPDEQMVLMRSRAQRLEIRIVDLRYMHPVCRTPTMRACHIGPAWEQAVFLSPAAPESEIRGMLAVGQPLRSHPNFSGFARQMPGWN